MMFAPYASSLYRAFLIATLLCAPCLESAVLSQTLESRSIEGGASTRPGQSRAQADLLAEAEQLSEQSQELAKQNKNEAAISLEERAVKIYEQVLGPEHSRVGGALGLLASLYKTVGDNNRAESLLQRALQIFEKNFGRDHFSVSLALVSLADLYTDKSDYDRAHPLYERALKIRETALGPDHTYVASVLLRLFDLYKRNRDHSRSESLLRRALKIFETKLGPDDRMVGVVLRELAWRYVFNEDYAQAEPLFRRALQIRVRLYGPEHPSVAALLSGLAVSYTERGEHDRAEPLLQRALLIFAANPGSDDYEMALALSDLATLYVDRRDFARAEPAIQLSLNILEKKFGPSHLIVAASLMEFARPFKDAGDYDRAEPLIQRALMIRERKLGPDHVDVAEALGTLGMLYMFKGEPARAEPLFRREMNIYEKKLGPDDLKVGHALGGLALSIAEIGKHDEAKILYQRALRIYERVLGPDDRHVGSFLNNYAILYLYEGDYIQSEILFQRALKIFETKLGTTHHDVATPLSYLARVYEAKGEITQAVSHLKRAEDILEDSFAPVLATGSEKHKQLRLGQAALSTNHVISFHLHSAPRSAEAARLALTTILRRKGRTLDVMTEQTGALRHSLNPQDSALLSKLAAVRSQRASLALNRKDQSDALSVVTEINRLDAERDQLEGAMSRRGAELLQQAPPVTLERVQQAIPQGMALVELVSYRPFKRKGQKIADTLKGKQTHYAAYVIRGEGEPSFVDLGEASVIERAIRQFRVMLADPKSEDVKQSARALDDLVMRPVRKLLAETRTVLLSPDGELNLVPFAALVDEQGQYLVENYTFTYLTSGRDLLRLNVLSRQRQPPLVVANPSFDFTVTNGDHNDAESERARGRRSLDFNIKSINALPGTAQEAADIKHIMPDARVLIEREATEAALKQVTGPRILHVATHGFFLKDQPTQTVVATRQLVTDEPSRIALGENPLLRSGLLLAGVKKRQSGAGEDGVLTALEVSSLDLWGTKLVILSACETGIGDVKNGEGVYGLRRALVLAGSETQMMSLWKVSDAGTRDLMVAYYTRLQRGESRTEALRQVQLAMLKNKLLPSPGTTSGKQKGKRETGEIGAETSAKDYRHPYYWASFIPSGDWRSLPGQER